MTREEVLQEIISLPYNNLLLTLPTGFGKTRCAIERIKSFLNNDLTSSSLLIVVPRNVLKVNWMEEINKWWHDCKLNITFTTYVSFPKCKGEWDYVIFDEAHHLSERCREALTDFNIKNATLLSATVKRTLKDELIDVFKDLHYYNASLRDAIDNGILPDPVVYLLPLVLDNKFPTERIIRNPKAKGKVICCSWATRWQYIKQKNNPVHIFCTQAQYLLDLDSQIEWYKKQYLSRRTPILKNKWLKLCGDRLKYLSNCKTQLVLKILEHCSDYRTLTFCNGIEQTEQLGHFCINSKNSESEEILRQFNHGFIDHITACNMLNEGMNLINCRIGIYANLNSSKTIVKQRTGRLLRHNSPIIIIPYYSNTREEELVTKMLEDYNPELIKKVKSIDEIIIE